MDDKYLASSDRGPTGHAGAHGIISMDGGDYVERCSYLCRMELATWPLRCTE